MRMAERVELHGGELNGQFRDVPAGSAAALEVEVTFLVDGRYLKRKGVYTRVHQIDGRPEKHFEWIGFVTPYVPVTPQNPNKEISHD